MCACTCVCTSALTWLSQLSGLQAHLSHADASETFYAGFEKENCNANVPAKSNRKRFVQLLRAVSIIYNQNVRLYIKDTHEAFQ